MKPIRTLVLVAADENARFLLNEGVGKGLSEFAEISIRQFADAQIDYDDRKGRQTGGPEGVARHGYDPHESADELSRARFAAHVIATLADCWGRLRPDRLIIAALPKMLGALRSRLDGAPAAALTADLAKDLVKVPARDLPAHLSGVMAV